jgi:histidine triad (HIT) family protein
MPECIFCRIARGEIPSLKVYEDDLTLAFLDINPAMPGHTLVIPKTHTASLFDVDDKTLQHTISAVKKVADKIHADLRADVSVLQNNGRGAEQGVDHMHFHVIPRMHGDGLRLHPMPRKMTEQQMKEMQRRLEIKPTPAPSRRLDVEHEWEKEF